MRRGQVGRREVRRFSEGLEAQNGGPAEGGGGRVESPTFRVFPLLATFRFVFPLWVSSRGFLVVFGSAGAVKCARLEFSGCRVSPGGPEAQTRTIN